MAQSRDDICKLTFGPYEMIRLPDGRTLARVADRSHGDPTEIVADDPWAIAYALKDLDRWLENGMVGTPTRLASLITGGYTGRFEVPPLPAVVPNRTAPSVSIDTAIPPCPNDNDDAFDAADIEALAAESQRLAALRALDEALLLFFPPSHFNQLGPRHFVSKDGRRTFIGRELTAEELRKKKAARAAELAPESAEA
jgi:hypothetical protein